MIWGLLVGTGGGTRPVFWFVVCVKTGALYRPCSNELFGGCGRTTLVDSLILTLPKIVLRGFLHARSLTCAKRLDLELASTRR